MINNFFKRYTFCYCTSKEKDQIQARPIWTCIWSAEFDLRYSNLLAVASSEDIAFQFDNGAFLFLEQSLSQPADRDDANHTILIKHRQMAHMIFAHQFR